MIEDFLKDYGIEIGNTKSEPTRDNSSRLSDINTNYEHDALFSGVGSKIGEQLGRYSYDLTHLQPEKNKYGKYNVYVNPVNSEEELKKERAKNQSAMEQLGRMVGQMTYSEFLLGTGRAISDFIDFGINLFKEEGQDDYTNAVSKFFEEQQTKAREALEIYQEDPNKTFAFGDFGWWTGNAVSMASTLMLLYPSKLLTKGVLGGINLLGKATKVNGVRSAAIGLHKVGNAAKAANLIKNNPIKPATLARQIKSAGEIGTQAFISRTMENYIEARDVYNTVYEDTKQRLSEMKVGERQQFLSNNPQFEGKSDEEIAKYISSISADKTFQNDYAMLLMDMVQLKSLSKISKGVKSGVTTTKKRIAEENFKKTINGVPKDQLIDAGFFNTTKQAIKYFKDDMIKNPLKSAVTGLNMIGLDEGIEEMYQGIQIEKGKEVAEGIFNPHYNNKLLSDYLQDWTIWEQAFWGVIGGLGFKGGANYIYAPTRDYIKKKRLEKLKKANKISEQDFNARLMTYEKQALVEIEGRMQLITNLKSKIEAINKGINPYEYKKDENGKYIIENDSKVLADATEEEKPFLKEKAINEFVSQLVLKSADAGNYESLRDSLRDSQFDKYLKEQGIDITAEDKSFTENLISQMDDIFEMYNKDLDYAMGYIETDDLSQNRLIAHNLTLTRLNLKDLERKVTDLDEQINSAINVSGTDATKLREGIDNYQQKANVTVLTETISQLLDQAEKIKSWLRNGSISKSAYDAYMEDLDKKYEMLRKFANTNLKEFNSESVNDFITDFNNHKTKNATELNAAVAPAKNIQDLMENRLRAYFDAEIYKTNIPTTEKEYQDFAEDINYELSQFVKNKLLANSDKLIKWIEDQNLKTSEEIDEAINRLMTDDTLPKQIKNAVDAIKLGYTNKERYKSLYINFLTGINELKKEKPMKVDGVTATEKEKEKLEKIDEEAPETSTEEKKEETETESTESPSTGKKISLVIDTTGVGIDETDNSIIDISGVGFGENKVDIVRNDFNPFDDDINFLTICQLAQDFIYDLLKTPENIEIFRNIKDINDENANKIINWTTSHIKSSDIYEQHPISEERIPSAVLDGLKSTLEFLSRKPTLSTNTKENFNNIVKQIARGVKVNTGDDMTSLIETLTDSTENELIEELLDLFINYDPITKKSINSNNKHIIDVERFARFLLSDPNISYSDVINCLIKLNKYIDANVALTAKGKNKVDFKNRDILNNFEKNPQQFINNYSPVEGTVVEGFHINKRNQFSTKQDREDYNKAIALVSQGKAKIRFILNTRTKSSDGSKIGERMWSIIPAVVEVDGKNVEIGYLLGTYSSTDNNTIELDKAQRSGLHWIIKDDENGITTNFDEFFDKLVDHLFMEPEDPNYNEKYGELINLLMKYNSSSTKGVKIVKPIMDLIKDLGIFDNSDDKFDFAGYDITKKFDEQDGTAIQYANKQLATGIAIIDDINNILINNPAKKGIVDINPNILKQDIDNYKKSIFENYKQTKQIRDLLLDQREDGSYSADYVEAGYRKVMSDKLNYSASENFDLNDEKYEWDTTKNVVIALSNMDSRLHTEDGKSFNNPFGKENDKIKLIGSMGLLVDDNGGKPLIAFFKESNTLTDNEASDELREGIESELVDILNKFNSSDISEQLTVDEIYNMLSELLSSAETKSKKVPKLFKGISVVKTKRCIAIINERDKAVDGKIKPIANLWFKSTSDKDIRQITYNDPNSNVSITIKGTATKFKTDIAPSITKALSHNASFFMIQNLDKTDDSLSRYYKRGENGEFIVKIGKFEKTYKNYASYVINNNAFKTNQEYVKTPVVEEVGSKIIMKHGFYQSENIGDIYVDVEFKAQSVKQKADYREGAIQTNKKAVESVLNQKENEFKTIDVLSNFHNSIDLVNIFNKLAKEGIELVPETFTLDRTTDNKLFGYFKDGKIYVTKYGLNPEKNKYADTTDVVRILMHEQIHRLINKHNVFKSNDIVNDLIETYNDFVNAINSENLDALDENQRTNIENIKNIFVDGVMSPHKYINARNQALNIKNGNNKLKTDYTSIDELSDEDLRIFAEEWLVEAMTQKPLTNYLNSKIVGGDEFIEDKKDKTIWEKIIDAILKIFDLDFVDTNKSSILAKQIKALNNAMNTNGKININANVAQENKENTDNKDDESINDDTPEGGNLELNDLEGYEEDSDEVIDEIEELTSIIDTIPNTIKGETIDELIVNSYTNDIEVNINGSVVTKNMNDFLAMFAEQDKPIIAKMLKSNQIKFVCK